LIEILEIIVHSLVALFSFLLGFFLGRNWRRVLTQPLWFQHVKIMVFITTLKFAKLQLWNSLARWLRLRYVSSPIFVVGLYKSSDLGAADCTRDILI